MGEGGCDVIPGLEHRFDITSPLSRADAMAAISRHIEPVKWFRLRVRVGFWTVYGDPGTDKFEGEITPEGFIAERIMGYGNFCPPRSVGAILAMGRGSSISVRMTPSLASVWLPAVLALVLIASVIWPTFTPDWTGLALAALLVAAWIAAFWFEAMRQEATMRRIFQAA
jgi:hypothetical protein